MATAKTATKSPAAKSRAKAPAAKKTAARKVSAKTTAKTAAKKTAAKTRAKAKTAPRKTAAKKPAPAKATTAKTATTKTATTKTATAKPARPRAIAQPVIRRIWPMEADGLRRHLCRLSREDRILRFGRPVTNRFIQTYVDRIDWFRDIVIGAVIEGEIKATGILTPIGWRLPLEGSAAIAVETDLQGFGLGSELTKRMLTIGRNRFMSRVYMLCLVKNDRMNKIAEKFGGEVDKFRDETVEAQFDLSRPTPRTVVREAVSEGLALGRTVVGRVPVLGGLTNGRHAA